MSEKSKESRRPVRNCRKNSAVSQMLKVNAKKARQKEKENQVKAILKKEAADRTLEEKKLINTNRKVVKVLEKRAQSRELMRQKSQEIEDSAEEFEQKVGELAQVVRNAQHLVVYTGAGISTAASIPDYRGPNGVWTLLQQGKADAIQNNSLVDAEPTFTHMALASLVHAGKVKHIVSQNCDGLHLRSGIPQDKLSELHGNMYIEFCMECKPEKQYIRLFDVTELTSLRRHKTSRQCLKCGGDLRDTIVHFGEKGVAEKPLNWKGAVDAADDADVILCLGSSLKVLRRYQCLWNTDVPKSQRPGLYIVNLQWTPKDSQAALKINAKCDDVMLLLMKQLGLQVFPYSKNKDPIFKLATPLRRHEVKSFSTKCLSCQIETRQNPQEKQEARVISTQSTTEASTSVSRVKENFVGTLKKGFDESKANNQKEDLNNRTAVGMNCQGNKSKNDHKGKHGHGNQMQDFQAETKCDIKSQTGVEVKDNAQDCHVNNMEKPEGNTTDEDTVELSDDDTIDMEQHELCADGDDLSDNNTIEMEQNEQSEITEDFSDDDTIELNPKEHGGNSDMSDSDTIEIDQNDQSERNVDLNLRESQENGHRSEGLKLRDPEHFCSKATGIEIEKSEGSTGKNVPGWFGKGYKKRVKRVGKRRKSRVSSTESGT